MGHIRCALRLTNLDGGRTISVEALVDTGSTYSVIPAHLLDELGVSRTGAWGAPCCPPTRRW